MTTTRQAAISPVFRTGWRLRGLYVRRLILGDLRAGVYLRYDGLIYSLGFLVGWPIILFRLPNVCVTWDATPLPM